MKQTGLQTPLRAALCLALATSLSGCVFAIGADSDEFNHNKKSDHTRTEERNRSMIGRLPLGSDVAEVQTQLGNPDFVEALRGKSGEYRHVYPVHHQEEIRREEWRDPPQRDRALDGRQRVEGDAGTPPVLRDEQRAPRLPLMGARPLQERFLFVARLRAPPAQVLDAVFAQVYGDSVDPGAELRVAAKRVHGFEHLHEHLLRHVLRFVPPPLMSLVLAVMLLGVMARSRSCALPRDRSSRSSPSASRPPKSMQMLSSICPRVTT